MDKNNIMEQLSGILSDKNNNIPDNIKDIFNNINKYSDTSNNSESENISNNSDNSNIDIDINMLLKAKQIADSMKTPDPRSNLLQSLKPYLKDEKKDKIDQYIKLLSLTKIIDKIGPEFLGSDKNDK